MSFKYLIYVFTISLIITGCSTTDQQVKKTIGEFDNAPKWVKAPKVSNYISANGNSTSSNKLFIVQRDEAIENAKANLYKKLQVKIYNIFSIIGKKYADDEIYLQKVVDANNEIVSHAINESRVMKLYKSNKNNIYIMVSSDIKKIKKDLQNIVNTSFKEFSSVSSEYRLHLEQGNIDIELNN